MSDQKWKQYLNPVMSRAVSALTGLISADLLDKLLEKGSLYDEQYEKFLQSLDDSRSISKDVARKLLVMLKQRPPPSFDNFCDVIKQAKARALDEKLAPLRRRVTSLKNKAEDAADTVLHSAPPK